MTNRFSGNGRTRVLCVDDHGLLAEGLKVRLGAEPDLEVVGCLGDGRRVLEETTRLSPDVVLMDLEMPELDGLEGFGALVDPGLGEGFEEGGEDLEEDCPRTAW